MPAIDNVHSYHTTQILRRWTDITLGGSVEETFRNIASSRGPLNGYLAGVHIKLEFTLKQGSATAALTKEEIWGIADKITLEGNRHYWLSNVPGEAVFQQMVNDQSVKSINTDDWVSADLPNDTNDHVLVMTYLVPIAPKRYMPGITKKGLYDGIWPLSMMRDQGRLKIDFVNSLTSAWDLKSATYIVCRVLLHTYYSSDVIFAAPWRFDTFTTSDSEAQYPGIFGKIDSLWVCDDAFAAFTLPTGTFRLTVDGLVLQDDINGDEAVSVVNLSTLDAYDDIVDNNMLPIIHPSVSGSLGNFPVGTTIKVTDASASQSGGNARYNIRRYLPLDPEQISTMVAVMGVKFNPQTDRGLLEVGRRPLDSLGMALDRAAGWAVRVRQ
jgi:hypothetical protein